MVDKLCIRGLVVTSMGPLGVNDHEQQATVVTGRRFSTRERLPGKHPFTYGSDPQNKWWEDYPLLILEDGPSPPDDDEIAE